MATELSWIINLKLARFVFDAGATTPQGTTRDGARSAHVGRLYAMQWTRMNKPTPLGRTRMVRAADPTSGASGAVVDFVSHPASFVIEDSAFDRPQDRIVMFQLLSRDASPLGNGGRSKDGKGSPSEQVVASGTIDLHMFRESRPRSYALTLESHFFGVGKLHFSLHVAHNTRAPRTIEETAIVIAVDTLVDGFCESRENAIGTGASPRKPSVGGSAFESPHAPTSSATRPLILDNGYFGLRIEMDEEHQRVPLRQGTAGRVVFNHSVRLHPAQKVRFVLFDEQRAVGHAAVKVDKLTANGLPKDFALPLKTAPDLDVRLHFTVREETVTREVAPDSAQRDTPTPAGDTGGSHPSSQSQFTRTPTPGAAGGQQGSSSPAPRSSSQQSPRGPSASGRSSALPLQRPGTAMGDAAVSPPPSAKAKASAGNRPPAISTKGQHGSDSSSSSRSSPTRPSSESSLLVPPGGNSAGPLSGTVAGVSTETRAGPPDADAAEVAALRRRVAALETMLQEAHDRIYYQERDIEDLGAALTQQSAMVGALQQLLGFKHGAAARDGSSSVDGYVDDREAELQHSAAGHRSMPGHVPAHGARGQRYADPSGIVTSRPPSIAATTPRTHTPVTGHRSYPATDRRDAMM